MGLFVLNVFNEILMNEDIISKIKEVTQSFFLFLKIPINKVNRNTIDSKRDTTAIRYIILEFEVFIMVVKYIHSLFYLQVNLISKSNLIL